jgi:hypothetical protein
MREERAGQGALAAVPVVAPCVSGLGVSGRRIVRRGCASEAKARQLKCGYAWKLRDPVQPYPAVRAISALGRPCSSHRIVIIIIIIIHHHRYIYVARYPSA